MSHKRYHLIGTKNPHTKSPLFQSQMASHLSCSWFLRVFASAKLSLLALLAFAFTQHTDCTCRSLLASDATESARPRRTTFKLPGLLSPQLVSGKRSPLFGWECQVWYKAKKANRQIPWTFFFNTRSPVSRQTVGYYVEST